MMERKSMRSSDVYYLDESKSPLKEQVEVTNNDVIIKGISAREVMKGAAAAFKKKMKTHYELAKEVSNEKEMNDYAFDMLRTHINKGMMKTDMLDKLSEKQIKDELLDYAVIVLSGEFTLKAMKTKNKWLEQKTKLLGGK